MKVIDLKNKFIAELSGLYPSEEVRSFFKILSEYFLNYTRLETTLNPDKIVSEENRKKFESAIARLKKFEPVQYITGHTEFYGLPFKVNRHTLIPRPETEELVAWILDFESTVNRTSNIVNRTFLDVGTGSGCIAVSLAKNLTEAYVSALDFSSEALRMAAENSKLNNVYVDFFELNILTAKQLPRSYQVIVSNPPYVREMEKEQMRRNVLEHEPRSALFVSNEDPLLYYRKIARLASVHLTRNGALFFEINEYLGKELKTMLESEGFTNVLIKKDIFGKDRMLRCSLTDE